MARKSFVPRQGTGWGRAKPGATKVSMIPAPAMGINAADPMATLGMEYSTYQINLIPDGRGSRVRSGYQQFVTGVGADVRTVIPFQGLSSTNNRLFGVTEDGIYDFTAGGTGPWVADESFASPGNTAGWGVWTSFTATSGLHYGFYADEDNGLFRLLEGGSWAPVTDITGVDELDLVFVVQHKSRLWFVERGTATAWYLGVGNISGAASAFNFGSKFAHGGTLVGLWNWTVDGGDGIDDYLVAMSSSGDVIVYRFTDPADTNTFLQVSQYYIGQPPAGRRVACQSGGELFILSQLGVLPMSRLVSGRPVQEQDIYASRNITPLLTNDLDLTLDQMGWELKSVPAENVLILNTPKVTGYPYKQYALSTKTSGWCVFNGLPYITGEMYDSLFYIGDEDGLNLFTGNQDEVTLADGTGVAREFSILTAFSDAGDAGQYHRVQFMRPVFRSGGNMSYDTEARYDYNTDDFIPSLTAAFVEGALWDVGLWDTAIWGQDLTTVDTPMGGSGIGRAMAVALAGQTSSETTLIRIDIMYDTGGML
jgi:hypothetical protein